MRYTLGLLIAVIVGAVWLTYGTLSPCGMLRETVRKQDGLAAVLPDALVDAAIASKIGALTPGRCLSALVNGNSPPAAKAAVATAATPASATASQGDFSAAQRDAVTAINICRKKRLQGELKTFVSSARCAHPGVYNAYKSRNYPYMDLVETLLQQRMNIASRIDHGEISEAEAQKANSELQQGLAEIEKQRMTNAQR